MSSGSQVRPVDAVIVGAGFAGLYALHRFRELGLSVLCVDAADGVGGTWYWNRYPGARCDIESLHYSYSFSPELEQEWHWTERYAAQPEILRYLNHVADRFDLRRDVQLGTRVTALTFDDDGGRWAVDTDRGGLSARFVVMATGCLSVPQEPALPGLDAFAGPVHATSRWPQEGVDFTGRRVAVIGTGSSGVQVIPRIAEQAGELLVFQRTPAYAIPAGNGPLDPEVERRTKARYPAVRETARQSLFGIPFEATEMNQRSALDVAEPERTRYYEELWSTAGLTFPGAFGDLMVNPAANDTAVRFLAAKVGERVRDPEVARTLTPGDYPLGTKRMCLDVDYYETFNENHVQLIDLREDPIEEITAEGIRTAGRLFPVDSIVLATGFDAITGALLAVDVRGRGGACLRKDWAAGPSTYLGLAIAGYPNLFVVTGPGSPSVISNMVVSIEQHVEWITDCVRCLDERGIRTIEATAEAAGEWTAKVRGIAGWTLYPTADSWYVGANIPGKPRGFMPYLGGVGGYRAICDGVAAGGYPGFTLTP